MAEVCLLPDRPRPPEIGSPSISTVPPATDLKSALAAINALRGIVQQLTTQIQPQDRKVPPGRTTSATTVKPSNSEKNKKDGPWREVGRKTERIRVENPDDSSQFVMIEVINSITMQNQSTGERWTWRR